MKTDIITVFSDLRGREEAMDTAERFAAYNGIKGKEAMHLRLLTEETICMVHGILDDFRADFWLETEKTKHGLLCKICLSADKQANRLQEKKILSVSTSGKNENAKGIAGKIREVLRRSLQTESAEDEQFLKNISDACLGMGTGSANVVMPSASFWSLSLYRQNLSEKKGDESEEWDELEKSIISKLADEVKVWLESDRTEVVIERYFNV
ncbi:MAG: hypothetical protein K6G82_03385 [Ruminococcus sp.]|nr:hypothetical protein [Ruminococcus sp.]